MMPSVGDGASSVGGGEHRTSGAEDQAQVCSWEPVDLEEEVIYVL